MDDLLNAIRNIFTNTTEDNDQRKITELPIGTNGAVISPQGAKNIPLATTAFRFPSGPSSDYKDPSELVEDLVSSIRLINNSVQKRFTDENGEVLLSDSPISHKPWRSVNLTDKNTGDVYTLGFSHNEKGHPTLSYYLQQKAEKETPKKITLIAPSSTYKEKR